MNFCPEKAKKIFCTIILYRYHVEKRQNNEQKSNTTKIFPISPIWGDAHEQQWILGVCGLSWRYPKWGEGDFLAAIAAPYVRIAEISFFFYVNIEFYCVMKWIQDHN